MLVSYYRDKTDVRPITRDLPWPVEPHRFDFTDKLLDPIPAFCPGEMREGTTRELKNVERVHFGVLDFDKKTEADLEQLSARLEALNLKHLYYSTWSHKAPKKGVCGRLVFPFSRPVSAAEYKVLWNHMDSLFACDADPICADASHIYYIPVAPKERAHLADFEIEENGVALDVDNLPPALPPTLRKQIAAWIRGYYPSKEHGKWIKEKTKLLLKGESLADEGERDTTLFKLVSALVSQNFAGANVENMSALFAPSVACMDPTSDDWASKKIERAFAAHEQEQQERQHSAATAQRDLIKRAFRSGRDEPYTPEELAEFGDMSGRWILQRDRNFYLFFAGEYRGPYSQNAVISAANLLLAPACSAGVSTEEVSEKGKVRAKSILELMRSYGALIDVISADLTAQRSTFDARTATLVEAPCPRRVLTSEFSPRVDKWLRLFGNKRYGKLADWISVILRLDAPCSALYIEGIKGAGKSLFAHGAARLWTLHGPTPLGDAISNFNDRLLQCPLVFADEVVPVDHMGRARTGELREFIQARQRSLRRKYLDTSTVNGSVRLIFAANNRDLLSTNENLTTNDIDAIVDRVLHIEAHPDAAEYLKTLTQEERDALVDGDEIARHFLWITENHTLESNHRFFVTGERTDLHRSLTVATGIRSAVCHWLWSFLDDPMKMQANKSELVMLRDGCLYVTAHGMARFWSLYETNCHPPQSGPLSKAIAGLSLRRRQLVVNGLKCRYRQIDPENLIAWCEINDIDTARIREILPADRQDEGL